MEAILLGMDLAEFLVGILPAAAIAFVCVVAFRRRRRRSSPLVLNPYTLMIEPDADAQGRLPIVQPMPPTTTSQGWDGQDIARR